MPVSRGASFRGWTRRVNALRLSVGSPTLADRLFPRSLLTDLVLVVGGVALISAAAQFVVPLWPVPSTGQGFAVLTVGYLLGPVRGGISTALYVTLGGLGLPVFNRGGAGVAHLTGETGGYLFAFVLASVLTGWFASRGWDRRIDQTLVGSIAVSVLIIGGGALWLMLVHGFAPADALESGIVAVLIVTALNIVMVTLVVAGLWRFVHHRRRAETDSAEARTPALRY